MFLCIFLLDSKTTLYTFCSRIDGSSISGKIPSFLGNWTKLDRLLVYIFFLRKTNFIFYIMLSLFSIFWRNFILLIGICREHLWRVQFLPPYLSWNFWPNCEYLLLFQNIHELMHLFCILLYNCCGMQSSKAEYFLLIDETFLCQENNRFERTNHDISWSEGFEKHETTVSWNIFSCFCEKLHNSFGH